VFAGAQAGIPLSNDAGYGGWQIFKGAAQLARCLLYDCEVVLGCSRGAASANEFQPEIPLGLRQLSQQDHSDLACTLYVGSSARLLVPSLDFDDAQDLIRWRAVIREGLRQIDRVLDPRRNPKVFTDDVIASLFDGSNLLLGDRRSGHVNRGDLMAKMK
jgi:hypothetical protein